MPGDPRPAPRGAARRRRALGVIVGHLPATRRWERGGPGPARAVRDRDRGRDAQRPAVRAGGGPEPAAARAGRRQGRLPPRRVSHNLQTPLASIRAYADQIVARATRPAARRSSPSRSDRLSRMVRQLLTVTRLESGALRPTQRVVALASAGAASAWEGLGRATSRSSSTTAPDGWLAVADADQLDQVLWALLDNALKYGRGTPDLGPRSDPTPSGRACALTIRDGGPGRERCRPRATVHALRARRSAERTSGSGLGLYVSRELCRAMGGDLDARPAPRGGRSGGGRVVHGVAAGGIRRGALSRSVVAGPRDRAAGDQSTSSGSPVAGRVAALAFRRVPHIPRVSPM